jgi:hypothetical protein
MHVLTPTLETRFRDYVEAAGNCARNLEFLLDNLSRPVLLDYSVASLEKIESSFWCHVEDGMPEGISDLDHFAHLIGQ